MSIARTSASAVDPVCGMSVDSAHAAGEREYGGQTYYFCSDSCKTKFDADPARYATVATSRNNGMSQHSATDGSRHTRSTPDGQGERVDLPITGMSCASCARRIEQSLQKSPGVRRAGVNFATARATVEYDPHKTHVRDLMRVVKDVGYEAGATTRADFVVDDSARPSGTAPTS